jgi:hypothetical protein
VRLLQLIYLQEETNDGIDFNEGVSTTVKMSSAGAGRPVME